MFVAGIVIYLGGSVGIVCKEWPGLLGQSISSIQ